MQRINDLQVRINENETWIISHPVDLFYLTGLSLSLGRLIITKRDFTLGVDGRYITYAQAALKDKAVLCEQGKWDILYQDVKGILVFDALYESYSSYEQLQTNWIQAGGTSLLGRKGLTSPLRAIKDHDELVLMKKAAFALEEGFSYICTQIREGITEKELSCKLQVYWLEKMGLNISFDPIIAFGANSALPHAKPRDVALNDGDLILIDIGVAFGRYQSDMTRMVLFGAQTEDQKKITQIVLQAHKMAVAAARPGVAVSSLDRLVREYFAENGLGDAFLHSLGHGIGLDVHESPSLRATSDEVLQEGMVITIEPGLYLEGLGGVRLENTYLVTKSGLESLMVSSLEPIPLPVR